jgi:elongation factor G
MLFDVPISRHRNIGIIAHIDAGKTTCSERMLFYAGRIHRTGEVHHGDTELDYMPQEQEMGITITAAATRLSWKPEGGERHRIDLVDTPGHVDFTVEVERSLRVLDGAVALFDAGNGVEPQSETVWRQADRHRVPRIAFINKMDKVGASFAASVASIRERLGARAVPVQIPLGEESAHRGVIDLLRMRAIVFGGATNGAFTIEDVPAELAEAAAIARAELCEACADFDDGVLERVVEGRAAEITEEELQRALRKATLRLEAVPVLCGSAHKHKGIQMLLDAVCRYLPSPLDVGPVRGKSPETGAMIERAVEDAAPLTALAFKGMSLERLGSVTMLRVYSGSLRRGALVKNAVTGATERIGRLVLLHGNKATDVDAAPAGTIAAAIGLRLARTGDTIADPRHPIVLAGMEAPEPVVELAIEPRSAADQEKLSAALGRLAIEDPSLHVATSTESGQLVLRGMGELHLAIVVDRLRREHGVAAATGRPHVAYRETIARAARGEHRLVKQGGGPGQYAHVILAIAPAERGRGLVFTDASTGGAVPRELVPAVEQGVRGAMSRGVLLGYPLVDVEVRLTGGSFHPVDSKAIAFEAAGAIAFREAVAEAEPHVLEPIMEVEITTPEEHLGDVIGDAQRRRGTVEALGARGSARVVTALVPLAELFGHTGDLRSRTRGRASASMKLAHYARVPDEVRARIEARQA